TPHDAEVAATVIRRQIAHMFGKKVAESTRVLYGASANKDNAASLMASKGIDGLLLGGASLKADQFCAITEIAHKEEQ
ncbi:MAG TPA: triose-phosphate isomerase, partial [Candidatus Saccharimonadaceae bacterium]|nr:triose-phosphate isomerase [Candidatus Saccharimonadaceae bacterium]